MKIYVYDSMDYRYEIKSIEYTQFNGKDTLIELLDITSDKSSNISFEGWLSLPEILIKLENLGK